MKRSLLYGLMLAALVLTPSGAGRAQNPEFDIPPVTVYRKTITVREAMRFTNPEERNFVLDPNVPNVEVTLNIERLKHSAVAASIAYQARLIEPRVTCAMDGDIAHVYLLPPR